MRPSRFPGALKRHLWPCPVSAVVDGLPEDGLAASWNVRDRIERRVLPWLDEPTPELQRG